MQRRGAELAENMLGFRVWGLGLGFRVYRVSVEVLVFSVLAFGLSAQGVLSK